MDGNFNRAFVEAKPGGNLRLGNVFRVAGQPGFEGVEAVGFAGGLMFAGESGEGAIKQRQSPFAVELAVGSQRIPRRLIAGRGGVGSGIGGLHRAVRAAFEAVIVFAHAAKEMLHSAEKIGAEPPKVRVDGVNAVPGQEAGEEFLGEIAGRVFVRRAAADEGKDRGVIGGAQIAQRRPRLRGIAARRQHPRPFGGDESRRRGVAGR